MVARISRSSSLFLISVALGGVCGCPSPTPKAKTDRTSTPLSTSSKVWAQGKLMPTHGIVQINAIPGDRIDQILIEPGANVEADQPLVRLSSEQMREQELEVARRKLEEAKSQLDAKKLDLQLQYEAAVAAVESAEGQLRHARSQSQLADRSEEEINLVRAQVQKLQRLAEDPRTKAMVGSIEVDQRKFELAQLESKLTVSRSTAQLAVEAAELALNIAIKKRDAAERARGMADSLVPVGSLEMQVGLLEKQIERSRILAPQKGTILSLASETGELVSQMPIMELADLSKMSCWAEVHESDVGRLHLDDNAEIKSSALERPLHGKVVRIDRMVGSPQMRIPNPLAKTDFRAIPIWIEIDSKDVELAAKLIQLQVEVMIDTKAP